MRFFNTAGVCFPDRHYMLPPEPRLPDARRLIDEWQYFIVHAPRQTGKTTTLETLARNLTAGELPVVDEVYNDDVAYVRDLGLIAADKPARVANPIYREVIVRILGAGLDETIDVRPHRFVLADGQLDFPKILNAFAGFWAEHEEILDGIPYREVAKQLAFMAFLTRTVNGDGFVDREYGVGRGRIDLLVRKSYGDRQVQHEAIELKVWHPGRPDPLAVGLAQLDRYLNQLKLDTGTLVIFDRRPGIPPAADRTRITREQTPEGRTITLVRA